MPITPKTGSLFHAETQVATAPAARGEQPAWQVCFTPGQDCTGLVVEEIGAARQSIMVQAYSFTSVPILAGLKQAKARGVDVEAILDKTAAGKARKGSTYTAATYLTNAGVPVWVDTRVAIAHSKAMVIDDATVITGSFNFTSAAQKRNAENLLVIRDPKLASRYRENWEQRRAVSMRFNEPMPVAPGARNSLSVGEQ